MPTYEYHCPRCKATYELRQGFDAETTHTCEECRKGVAKRVLYAPPVVFKGSGWYITDYAHKSSAAPAKNGEGGAQPAGGKAGEKTGGEKPSAGEGGAKKGS